MAVLTYAFITIFIIHTLSYNNFDLFPQFVYIVQMRRNK